MHLVSITYKVDDYTMANVELDVDPKTSIKDLGLIVADIGNAINRLTCESLEVHVSLNLF